MSSIGALRRLNPEEITAILSRDGSVITEPCDIARVRLLSGLQRLNICPFNDEDVGRYKTRMLNRLDAIANLGEYMQYLGVPPDLRWGRKSQMAYAWRFSAAILLGAGVGLLASWRGGVIDLLVVAGVAATLSVALLLAMMMVGNNLTLRYFYSRWEEATLSTFQNEGLGRPAPLEVMALAQRIQESMPGVSLIVEYLKEDPFLRVEDEFGNGFRVAVWNEREFRTTDC